MSTKTRIERAARLTYLLRRAKCEKDMRGNRGGARETVMRDEWVKVWQNELSRLESVLGKHYRTEVS